MGFNGFPSPKVFRITPTIHNYNKIKNKTNRILKLAAKFYHKMNEVKKKKFSAKFDP